MEINQDVLLHAFLKILVILKEERAESFRLSTEVAALRNTLQELSGDRFLPVVERHLHRIRETTASIEGSMLRDIDALVPLLIGALPEASPPRS
jgi:hypothetical protein